MIDLRLAVPEDSTTLTDLAHASKAHWGYPKEWLEAWSDELTFTPEYLAANVVVVATRQGVAVGCYALELHADFVELGHLWVLPSSIGSGIGRLLFDDAVSRVRSLGKNKMEILSDPNSEAFYEYMGAKRVRMESFEVCGQPRELPVLTITF